MNIAQNHETAPSDAPQSSPARAKRNWGMLCFLLLSSFVLVYVLLHYVVFPNMLPSELVGTWQVAKGEFKGATLEFRRFGTGVATMYKNGKKEATDSSVRVRGKRIYMSNPNPGTGMEDTLIWTVVQMTEDELDIHDQDDVTYHLIRIRD